MTAEREGGAADEEPAAREHHIPVTKTARYWTLGDPDGPKRDVWFVLHGYKQLARRFLRRFAPIAGVSRLIVAPEALSRFYIRSQPGRHGPESVVGATWMTREDREAEIHDYVAYLDQLAETVGVGEGGPTILGFSQGVATATRWVVHGTVRPRRLILWGDVTPPDLDVERARSALADVDITLVRGEEDGALAPELVTDEARRLSAAGVSPRVVRYAGGHDIDPETLVSLALSSR